MPRLPFKIAVDGRETIVHGGVGRIMGSSLEVSGGRTSELPEEVRPYFTLGPDYVHRFSMFCVPVREHEPWRETLRARMRDERTPRIEERYFGDGGFLTGRYVPQLIVPIRPEKIYRIFHVGRVNGLQEECTMSTARCYYTTSEHMGPEETHRKAEHFSLQEILYVALLHHGIRLDRYPKAVGKEFRIGVEKSVLEKEATGDSVIGLVFGDQDGTIIVNRDGRPLKNPYHPKRKGVQEAIIRYLRK